MSPRFFDAIIGSSEHYLEQSGATCFLGFNRDQICARKEIITDPSEFKVSFGLCKAMEVLGPAYECVSSDQLMMCHPAIIILENLRKQLARDFDIKIHFDEWHISSLAREMYRLTPGEQPFNQEILGSVLEFAFEHAFFDRIKGRLIDMRTKSRIWPINENIGLVDAQEIARRMLEYASTFCDSDCSMDITNLVIEQHAKNIMKLVKRSGRLFSDQSVHDGELRWLYLQAYIALSPKSKFQGGVLVVGEKSPKMTPTASALRAKDS